MEVLSGDQHWGHGGYRWPLLTVALGQALSRFCFLEKFLTLGRHRGAVFCIVPGALVIILIKLSALMWFCQTFNIWLNSSEGSKPDLDPSNKITHLWMVFNGISGMCPCCWFLKEKREGKWVWMYQKFKRAPKRTERGAQRGPFPASFLDSSVT